MEPEFSRRQEQARTAIVALQHVRQACDAATCNELKAHELITSMLSPEAETMMQSDRTESASFSSLTYGALLPHLCVSIVNKSTTTLYRRSAPRTPAQKSHVEMNWH